MTLASSYPPPSSISRAADFAFKSADFTKLLREHTSAGSTGFWEIQFDPIPGKPMIPWYISVVNGLVVFSGTEAPSWHGLLEVLQRYVPRIRRPKLSQQMQVLYATQPDQQSRDLGRLVKQMSTLSLISLEEVTQAIRLHALHDLDLHLTRNRSGRAFFSPHPGLVESAPISGIELNSLLLEAIKRRVEWNQVAPYVSSIEQRVSLTPKALSGSYLSDEQKRSLQGVIQDGQTLEAIASAMGKDTLFVAKSFLPLFQQSLLVVEPNLEARPATESSQSSDPTVIDGAVLAASTSAPPLIYIVDDSAMLVRQFQNLLENWGYRVDYCHDPEFAVENISKVDPTVIFLDVNMPKISGFDLIRQIRRHDTLSDRPLVMLTAEKTVSNQWRAQWASCKFLAKPRSPEDIQDFRQDLRTLLRDLAPLATDVLL
jgi:CheY-like chemotaxis protein